MKNKLKVHTMSLSDNWATPIALFNQLNDEFHFTLDACADEFNKKIDRYFDESINALIQEWDNITYCNPPYGRKIGLFVEKGYKEFLKGKTIVMLLPSRTDTRWFHEFILNKATEIRFIKGRLKFNDCGVGAPFPSIIVVYKNR
jgi:site-specific DNA-methyltransferase (adenine-specific)